MAKQINVNLSVTADTMQAKQQLQQLQSTLQQLKTTPVSLGANLDLSKTISQVGQLQRQLQQATNTETGVLSFTKLNTAIKASGTTLQDYGKALLSMGPQGQQAFNQLAMAVSKAQVPVLNLSSSFSQLWTAMKNTMRWQLSSSAIHAAMGAISTAWNYAQRLNESLNNIQIVTQMNDSSMAKFAESANKAAKALSTTTTSYTDAALIYYQQGIRDQKEIAERTNATIKMANVTGQTAQSVSNQMTAIWNNFDNGTKSLEYYADVITALGAATASSSEEISKGLEKFAAIANTVGLSYENATAALATITATTRQSADTVGTGLRTIFSRLESVSLGKTLEDGVNLTKYSKALATVGVNILDANGNLKAMDNILDELGQKWTQISDTQKTALAQTVGGVRQYTNLMALMNNYDFYKQNQQVAATSEGTLAKQQAIYEKSWEAANKRVKASAEAVYSDLLDDKFFITLTNGFSKLLDTIDAFMDGLGGIKGVLLGIVSLVTTLNQSKSTMFFDSVINGVKSLTPRGRESIQADQQKTLAGFSRLVENPDYTTAVGKAQNTAINNNLTAQQAYLAKASQYDQQQNLAAQSLLSSLEGLNGALVKTGQGLDSLTASTYDVRKALATTIGVEGRDTFVTDKRFRDIAEVKGRIDGLGLNADLGSETALKTAVAQAKTVFSNLTIDDTTLSTQINNLLSADSIAGFNGAMQNVMMTLEQMEVSLLQSVQTEEQTDAQRTRAAAAAEKVLDHETKLRAENVKYLALENEGRRITGQLQAGIPKQGTGVPTTGQYITEGMSLLSSTAMGFSMLRGVGNQFQAAASGQGSWGNALLSAGTSIPFAATMLMNAGSKFGNSKLLNLAFQHTKEGRSIFEGAKGEYINERMKTISGDYTKDGLPVFQNNIAGQFGKKRGQFLSAKDIKAVEQGGEAAGMEAVSTTGAEMGLAQLGPVLGMLGPYLLAIAAVGTAIWAASDLIVTSKERLDSLNKTLEQNQERVTETRQKYETLNTSFEKQAQLNEKINSSQIGSIERNTAILEANQNAQQIITENKLTNKDYTIKNGQIVFNEGVQERLQAQQLEAMQQAQRNLLTTQAEQAAYQNQVNYENLLQKAAFYNVDTGITTYSTRAAEKWARDNAQYGYTSGEEVIAALQSGELRSQMHLSSGAATKAQLALSQIALDKNGGKISDEESLLINTIAQDEAAIKEITDSTQINTSVWSAIFSGRKDGKIHANMSYSDLVAYASENYNDEYQELINSEEYQQAKRGEKRQKLAQLISSNEAEKKLADRLGAQQDLLNSDQLKAYKNYNNMTLNQLAELRADYENRKLNGQINNDIYELEGQINDELMRQYGNASAAFIQHANAASVSSEATQKALNNLTLKEIQNINSIYNTASSALGESAANIIQSNLIGSNGKLNETFYRQLQNYDFSEGGLAYLADAKRRASKGGVFGIEQDEAIREAFLAEKGEKGLFEELYESEDFADSLASLQKEFKKTGKISAKSILEAAESSETLNDWLDASGIGAQGLADALNALEAGNIDSVSEALIRAFGAAGSLNDNLAKTYDYIDNFNEERSVEDIGAFFNKRVKAVQSGFESGMLLDAPLLQSLESLFGTGLRTDYQKSVYGLTDDNNRTPQQISDEINRIYADEIAAMQSIQERGNLSGMFEYYGKKGSSGESMFDYNAKTGQVVAVSQDILKENGWDSQNGFIQGLIDNYDISEDMARAMASEYAAANGNIAELWRGTGARNGLAEFFGKTDNTSTEFISGTDIRAFYDAYSDVLKGMSEKDIGDVLSKAFDIDLSDFTGEIKSVDDLLNIIANAAEQTGDKFFDLGEDFNFTTSELSDLQERFDESAKKNGHEDFASYLNLDTVFHGSAQGGSSYLKNFDQVQERLEGLGATAEQAFSYIDTMRANGEFKDFETAIENADGKLTHLTSTSSDYKQYLSAHDLRDSAAAWDEYVKARKASFEEEKAINQQQQIMQDAFTNALSSVVGEDKKLDITVNIDSVNATNLNDALKDRTVDVTINVTNPGAVDEATGGAGTEGASGYNNAKGFAGGKHSNGQYEGLAEVGELGPELFIHDGQPYLAGINGRTKAYVHKDDSIYTAAQTQQILAENPSLQDIPGFSVGYNQVQWGKNGGANAGNAKTSKYDPERYHLITRQLKDLQREYDRLDKIKENCYGTNKLESIQREIDATNELIKGQKELVKEAEDYLKIDTERLKSLLSAGEFQVDENGNLLNFEALQEKYRKAAEESKDEHAQDVWKALQQYEETLDKLQEANVEMQDLLYQEMELRLEKITTKVEIAVDFDEREIKLLDHYIDKIDDNIYHSADVLNKTINKLEYINHQIEDTREGINEIFAQLSDSQGNLITKADGTAYTIDDWLGMTAEQRDLLDINDNFGKQLEEFSDNILEYLEDLEDLKTKGIEELGDAFDELNDNVRDSLDLFDHYAKVLESFKNIIELQNVSLSLESRNLIKDINENILNNMINNIKAEQDNLIRLNENANELREKIANTTDETLKKAWEEQLKTIEDEVRSTEETLLQLYQDGLDQAKTNFSDALELTIAIYEKAIAGAYNTLNGLQSAYDRKKEIDKFYVDDYEKYYQIAKLQRNITRDLDAAARNGNRQNQNMKKLYDELNAARENGVELTAYDLDIFAKRYEYEKAVMELEDARNAKNEVRLQRDANGNWGYVYTSSADEDDLLKKQQAVDDALYAWQKATQDQLDKFNDDIFPKIINSIQTLKDAYESGEDIPEDILNDTIKLVSMWGPQFKKIFDDAAATVDPAIAKYGEELFDITDNINETVLADLLDTSDGIDGLLNFLTGQLINAANTMASEKENYDNNVQAINDLYGDDFLSMISEWNNLISAESDNNLIYTENTIENAKNTFDEILAAAIDFENKFMEIYQPVIDANEQLLQNIIDALYILNHETFEGPIQIDNLSITDLIGADANGNIVTSAPSTSSTTTSTPPKKTSTPSTDGTTSTSTGYVGGGGGRWVLMRMATGGYTGEWGPEGRLAILHEKEQVFNKDDTQKLLNASQILRTIDLQTNLFSKGFGNIFTPSLTNMQQQALDQNVHIEASFPSVTDHNEIELAFDNLINKASQYANRKNMSSMTFQDMYTSKF